MVAQTAELPNLRRLFIPDPGYVMIEADLERADAQIVAWEAGDEPLKQMFREGADIHTENAMAIFGCTKEGTRVGGSNSPRQKAKVGVHAVDYYCKAKTLAAELHITIHEAELFINRWFAAHPSIPQWHERTWQRLRIDRAVSNIFGFRIYYFDRIDRSLLSDALAWIASSTVSIIINKGLVNVHTNIKEAQLLLQIHDSLLLQTHKDNTPAIYSRIHDQMLIPVPYPDPLTIPVKISASDKSWGDAEEVTLPLAA